MTSIILNNVSLEYPVYNIMEFSLRYALAQSAIGGVLRKKRRNTYAIRALKDISFTLHRGDRLGLIGHNGSGKTTLLKTISGVYMPTAGEVSVEGKVSTLFDMSLGMHADITGYESLYISSLIRGNDPEETKKNLPSMAAFTELGDYLHMPMRTYSAGMKMRIGFAVATEGVPDILLIDEVFGTGDKDFAEKCRQRLLSLIENTGILVFSSHSEALIRQLCNKVMVLRHGEVVAFGETVEVLNLYKKLQ